MSKLTNFKANELNKNQTFNLKGGVNFCEWYINQRAEKEIANGQMKKAMDLDAIAATQGEAAAMAQGGTDFLAKHS